MGVIAALARRGEVVFCDELSHASIADGCRLSGAEVVAYATPTPSTSRGRSASAAGARALIATDGMFGMDGDVAPLAEIVELARRYDARVLVDESHALGALGPGGRGAVADLGLRRPTRSCRRSARRSGPTAAFVACGRTMAKYLAGSARSFACSTAPAPPAAGGALAALELLMERPRRVQRLRVNAAALRAALNDAGFDMGASPTQILSIVVGDPRRAVRLCDALLDHGILAQTVRAPVVAAAESRLRLTVTASHRPEELRAAAGVIGKLARTAAAGAAGVAAGRGGSAPSGLPTARAA